jgi:hypothetical protein
VETKAILDETPKPNGEMGIDKEVIHRLRDSLAKWANTTIWPPSLLQAIFGPKSTLYGMPHKELNLWRGPNLSKR